jgi:hypothetical protein
MFNKRIFILFTLTTLITSCTANFNSEPKIENNLNNTLKNSTFEKFSLSKQEFSDFDKEYGQFTTKSLKQSYLNRKINHWLFTGENFKLLKELIYARYKHRELAQNFFSNNHIKYQEILDKTEIRNQMEIDIPFAEFMNPVPDIVTDGLVLNLDAGNNASYPGAGTTWTDLSGHNNNGTLQYGVSYSSQNQGSLVFNGKEFNGPNNSVIVPPINFGMNSYSINVWLNPKQNNILNVFTGYGRRQVAQGGWWIGFDNRFNNNPNGITMAVADLVDHHKAVNTPTFQYSANQWILVTGIFDRSASSDGIIKIYANGVLLDTTPLSDNTGSLTEITYSPDPICIGEYDNHRNEIFYEGKISVYQIYDRALSASEVLQNYNALKGRYQ